METGNLHSARRATITQAIRDELERQALDGAVRIDVEALAEAIDIVAEFVRGRTEGAVGHQQSAGGVIGEADAEQFARGGGGGYQSSGDVDRIMGLVRQAVELGADIIKADPTDDLSELKG